MFLISTRKTRSKHAAFVRFVFNCPVQLAAMVLPLVFGLLLTLSLLDQAVGQSEMCAFRRFVVCRCLALVLSGWKMSSSFSLALLFLLPSLLSLQQRALHQRALLHAEWVTSSHCQPLPHNTRSARARRASPTAISREPLALGMLCVVVGVCWCFLGFFSFACVLLVLNSQRGRVLCVCVLFVLN